jgi:AAA domain
MGTFQKPQPLKAALKMALFGPAGSGKTFTALLIAEGLANLAQGKRVALVDTEQGTAFYSQDVPARQPHPKAFDFDVLHTRSITEVLTALRAIDPARHGVVVIDSISHLWDSCKNAYTGKLTRQGSIPFHAWANIKKPYRELMHRLLTAPYHVLICGRQAVEYGEDETTGELAGIGYRMRAEGETGYEPDVLLRLEQRRAKNEARAIPVAHVEKDRTGVLAGRSIPGPAFDNVAKPLLGLLGATQASQPSDDEVGLLDAETLAREQAEQERQSLELAQNYTERFRAALTPADLTAVGQELTVAMKAKLIPADLERVRRAYGTRQGELQGRATGTAPKGEKVLVNGTLR